LEDYKALRRGAEIRFEEPLMSIFRPVRTVATAVAVAAALAVAASPASATPHSPTDDVTATPCKLDTSPSYPSCGTAPSIAILVHGTSFTATPCKLDTSPSYPSCGGQPR
jgi:hypothetical protein